MLYLAEVKKQTKGFIGGSKTELRLIACQRGDDRDWKVLPQEKLIACEEANQFGDGTMVVVNLGENQQIQGKVDLAADRVISILRIFSRLLSKTKEQEEEIERWKESLTIQSEELSRREMELAARLEQYEEMDEVGDEENASALRADLNSIFGSPDTLREKFNLLQAAVNAQQANLDKSRQQLEQQRKDFPQGIEQINRQQEELKNQKQELEKITVSIERGKTELLSKQNLLKSKQDFLKQLKLELKNVEELQEKITRLAIESGNIEVEQRIDISALENMPLGELQEIVNRIQGELEKVVRFVNEQEEELTLQCQSLEELQEKLNTASEYDRLSLEGELTDEQERKNMLDETLVGQRRNLRERQEILRQHLRILQRRLGMMTTDEDEQNINLEPVLQDLKNQRSNLEEKRQKLETEIEQLKQHLQQIQRVLQKQTEEQQAKNKILQEQEENWQQAKTAADQFQLRVKIHEETIEPLQASLNEIRQKLEALEQLLNKAIDSSEERRQAIA